MLPAQSSVREYVDLTLTIKWSTSSFLTYSLQNHLPPGWNWLLWSHGAKVLVCWHTGDIQMALTFYGGAYLQESLLVIVPTPRVSFLYTPIRWLPTLSSCIAQQSTLGTKRGASSCIWSIWVFPWDKKIMSRHMHLTFFVLITLFQCILAVSRSAVCTDAFPSMVIKLPPAVMRIQYGSSFWGRKCWNPKGRVHM